MATHNSFIAAVDALAADVLRLLKDGAYLQDRLDQEPDLVFIKSAEGRVLLANDKFVEANGNVSGQTATSFADEITQRISALSDELIMSGCQNVDLAYAAFDAQGRPAKFLTSKRELLESKSQFAVLIVSRIEKVLADKSVPTDALFVAWQAFQELNARRREIALAAALGEPMQSVADRIGVSKKTVENHRAEVLTKLGVTNTHELMRLLVRLQDGGYCTLGL